ncbi:MAG: acetyl-CoA carboxylase biotin carboxyl carrier protein [Planctomycetes bacterium]|nr:acetyl-CoA carboxylase biotin carboxyl carrier protein [Planctomycetota bacterium]MCB9904144.1 acetyl-CoA carboxylase biotin carboxyl carrier protein [Planctomycetota bacterium]
MVDLKLIRQLVRIMNNGGVSELEIDDEKEGISLRLRRDSDAPVAGGAPIVHMMPSAVPAQAAPLAVGAAPAAPAEAPSGPPPGTVQITSPMVGTFYRTPSPESPPFVDVGSRVDAETVVCIVEAMKVMNEIQAEVTGEVVQILVENGEPVEFGQPLMLVKKG